MNAEERAQAVDRLLSLPEGAAAAFCDAEPHRAGDLFVASDPPGAQLGSAGGAAHLLHAAWQKAVKERTADGNERDFVAWTCRRRRLIVHGSGESRRLPAYAAPGKPLLPMPPLNGVAGQRPDQVLMDLQFRTYERLFRHAPPAYRLMVACGDVLVRYWRWLPAYPEADVLIMGLSASPEEAQRHGVMVCETDDVATLAFFLQKPAPERLSRLSPSYVYYLDTGVWLLSERALHALVSRCGWDPATQAFKDGTPSVYDLYAGLGPALGTNAEHREEGISDLRCAVLPLPNGRFYHFGTNRSVIASVTQLQRPAAERRSFGHASMERPATPFILHSEVACTLGEKNRYIWIENSTIPADWILSQRHVLTGVPPNSWQLRLDPGACLDCVPVGDSLCLRPYGFDDPFRGSMAADATAWMDRPAADWFISRGLDLVAVGIAPNEDIHEAAIFPLLDAAAIPSGFVQWLLDRRPEHDDAFARLWCDSRRLSARELMREADVTRAARRRREHMARAETGSDPKQWLDRCPSLDLLATAGLYVAEGWTPPPVGDGEGNTLSLVHDRMFRSALARSTGSDRSARHEAEAFECMRQLIVGEIAVEPVAPGRHVLEDQIVWGRSPVRLDLAGGWTDTPPYCLEHDGNVVNVAADLNGQPPIQVFGRFSDRPGIAVRSIDLGIDDWVDSYEVLRDWGRLGSGFGVARAALALAGLDPRFHSGGGASSLAEQLEREFGGGIELSMLAAVPKGSGLGTSSILAATMLGVLSEMFGLRWSTTDLFARTLALEQMLTSGGGWQDQAGGLTGGIKLIGTAAGLSQKPTFRWLPGNFFSDAYANRQVLLYYTGLTRVAHDILGEIVRGLFLNSGEHLGIIEEIGQNALFAADVIQRDDWGGMCEAVRRSWQLNQRLDAGTNPPAVQAILSRIADLIEATKLLGAGGGGYMLFLAKDAQAAQRVRQILTDTPPNSRARFVDLSLSPHGFQVTRS